MFKTKLVWASISVFLLASCQSQNSPRSNNQAVESTCVPKTQGQLPIIDMHVHAKNYASGQRDDWHGIHAPENTDVLIQETYERFRRFNIVKAVVHGPLDSVEMNLPAASSGVS